MGKDKDLKQLIPGNKTSKHEVILNKLRDIENQELEFSKEANSFLPSSFLPEIKQDEPDEEDSDNWFNELMYLSDCKPKHSKKNRGDLFAFDNDKKKKKKKKKKGDKDLIDFSKEFDPEIALLRELLQDQNKFTDSLQKEYDAIKNVKSSSRGMNKTLTDLIENINGARNLSMQLVEKNVNVKKLIAELTMKQKKEFGDGTSEGGNMADFASIYIKKLINEKQNIEANEASDEITDYDDDSIFDVLSQSLSDDESSDESDKYLEYESRNITIYAIIKNEDTSQFSFIAKDEDGTVVEDYELPLSGSLSVNRSTNIATDEYGRKYPIIWE